MLIKYLVTFFTFLFVVSPIKAQESYDNCANALELCPDKTFSLNNIDATSTVCPNCEDDFNYCFSGNNTIWLNFTTNEDGGDVNLNFSNIVFQNSPGQGNGLQALIMETTNPCISSSYNLISNCESNAMTNFTLNATNLLPNTTYYVVINGTMGTTSNAEATFDLQMSGSGVARNPQFFIWTDKTTICKGNTVVLYTSPKECPDQSVVEWYVNGNHVGTTVDSSIVMSTLNDNDVVTAVTSCYEQCRDTLTSNSLTFTVYDFMVDAGEDQYILQGESVQLNGQTDGINIDWQPSVNMSDNTVERPVVSPEETTTYYMIVDNGICSITDEVTVFVDEDLVIPNTFSPNGDGINDTWEILGIDNYPDCGIQVFTRWGQIVFQTTGYPQDKRWNGTSVKDKKLDAGVYYYVINLRDEKFKEPLKGTVTIIR